MTRRRRSKHKQSPFLVRGLTLNNHRRRRRVDRAQAWEQVLLPSPVGETLDTAHSKTLPILLALAVGLIGLIFSWRLFSMQVLSSERYNSLANGNRIRERITFAPRGNIYDRNGVLLAGNTLSFRLYVTPYLLDEDSSSREISYQQIGRLSGLGASKVKQLSEAKGLDYPLPQLLKENVAHKPALALMEILPRLNGFSLSEVPTRVYNSEAGLANVVGYVGRVSDEDLKQDDSGQLLPIDFIGKDGIERQYDKLLRGGNGIERTEVDALGRPVRLLAKQNAKPGQDITLTIDVNVQKKLEAEMLKQMKLAKSPRAAAVAISPKNGQVFAMVSLPYFDNNLFARGITTAQFNKLINDKDQPLVNKVIADGFPSGSTIKPVVASAALEEKVVTPETIIVDRGSIAVTSIYQPGRQFVFNGWRPGGLGPMNIRRAIAMSSDIYFYTVGGGYGDIEGLGVDRLAKYYRLFGMGETSGIDLPGETAGRVPDRQWKKSNKHEDWYIGDTYNISIGQGDLVISPLQLTLADMSVANNGYLLKPELLLKVGSTLKARRTVRRELPVSKQNLQIVREGMRQVLTAGTTCECTFSKVPFPVAGKSGTAETNTPGGQRPHAWYTAFAPYEDPQIMVTVLLEEGSGGSLYAAPAVAAAMEAYFNSNR